VGGHHAGPGSDAAETVTGSANPLMSVSDHGSGFEASGGDRRPPGVDRNRHVEAFDKRRDHRHDAVELLLLCDLGPGAGLDTAHVERVGAFSDQLLAALIEAVQLKYEPRS